MRHSERVCIACHSDPLLAFAGRYFPYVMAFTGIEL